jgi:hypothetical protein
MKLPLGRMMRQVSVTCGGTATTRTHVDIY